MNINKTSFFYRILFFLLPFLIVSCSQTNNTALLRGWHNMNARYNGYFNSKENLKETVKKIEKANKDDYTQLLPIFIYPNDETAKNFFNDFDNSIKKSATVIQRHVIMNPRTKQEIPNACKWIDENYLLIGEAYLYKRELFPALETFEYVAKAYPQPKAKYAGKIWMMRADNEIGSYSLTEGIIDEIRSAKDFPKIRNYEREFALASADLYIKRNDYPQAIKQLTKAVAFTKNKYAKARYLYILAQLYQKLGDTPKASNFYTMVVRLHPAYDMEFSARINSARFYDVKGSNSKSIKRQLARMLRDEKNKEYRDQIYYALAEISYKEEDISRSLDYLSSSIKVSVSNNNQKALSYLKRGDIYFEKSNYQKAGLNYDSVMTFLSKDYPDYKEIETKHNSLKDLVTNLNTISFEDSVQVLAKMDETQRNKAIDNVIKQIEEEEKKAEELALLQKEQALNATPIMGTPVGTMGGTGTWYFYNPAIISSGKKEFIKRWGDRKLEDNWRRSEKDITLQTLEQETEEATDSVKANKKNTATPAHTVSKHKREDYLKNIPLTPDSLAASTVRLIDAYYNAGNIYKEQILNNAKSVETLEELQRRFPDNKYTLANYYQLYRTCLSMNNTAKSEYYKNLILTNYPKSEYAKIITNPDYAKDINASKNEIEQFYAETYHLYEKEKYDSVIINCIKAESQYSKSTLMPQFSFLKALSIGRIQGIDAFESALMQVVIKYPKNTEIKEKAEEMLEVLKQKKGTTAASINRTVNDTSKTDKFIFNESSTYYWIIIIEKEKGNIENFKKQLTNNNMLSFEAKHLSVIDTAFNESHKIIEVQLFNGKEDAMHYSKLMESDKALYTDLIQGTYQSFIISEENFMLLYNHKNILEYTQFYDQYFK